MNHPLEVKIQELKFIYDHIIRNSNCDHSIRHTIQDELEKYFPYFSEYDILAINYDISTELD